MCDGSDGSGGGGDGEQLVVMVMVEQHGVGMACSESTPWCGHERAACGMACSVEREEAHAVCEHVVHAYMHTW